jgi:intracellular septation protein
MNAQLRRLVLDLGPLIVFFAAFRFFGIYAATGAFMAAISLSLAAGYALERRLSPMAIVTAVLVLVFGGLTLYLKNDIFIKMKPTAIYVMIAALLLGGLAFNRLFIKYVLSFEFELPDAAWRSLTYRWAFFFLVIAVLNEIVWRNFSTAQWVTFKVWIIFPLVLIFGATQAPFLMRHMIEEKKPDA